MKNLFTLIMAFSVLIEANAYQRTVKIIETSDVHGCYYPYDFIRLKKSDGSLARVATYVDSMRNVYGKENVVLLDNGDILQGQPCAYYYNYIDTVSPHLTSEVLNFMKYDAVTVGNHDLETGHDVYDRWIAQNNFPTLGANVIDVNTGEPYLQPYAMIDKDSLRIAVLGLLTPAIPGWLPKPLWSGLEFEEMVPCAQKWIPIIQEKERPDLIVGLFHSGRDSTKTTGSVIENASLMVAERVPGFDIVFMGHDHSPYAKTITNAAGKEVIVLNPGNNAHAVGDVTITYDIDKATGEKSIADISGTITHVDELDPWTRFMLQFGPESKATLDFVDRVIGHTSNELSTHDAYFGSSAFVDFIHQMQLAISGAEISMCAPLSFDAVIPAGDIKVSDTFNLYKYENLLYTMVLTGQEIKDYLEMSYSNWINEMHSPDDPLLQLRDASNQVDMTHTAFKHPSYNFSSAAGIFYTVDVTKPAGKKIKIHRMADGSNFDLNKQYKVALNSYRGNGGGNLLTIGAGIPAEELPDRVINSTDRDLRYYLIQYISQNPELKPEPLNHWRFIPAKLVEPAIEREKNLLFNVSE